VFRTHKSLATFKRHQISTFGTDDAPNNRHFDGEECPVGQMRCNSPRDLSLPSNSQHIGCPVVSTSNSEAIHQTPSNTWLQNHGWPVSAQSLPAMSEELGAHPDPRKHASELHDAMGRFSISEELTMSVKS
jgi:hypothetical protein